MLSPLEIFRQMVTTDAQIVHNCTSSSFATYKQQLNKLGFTQRTNYSFTSENTQTSRVIIPTQPTQPSYNKIDDWQKQQDQLALQLTQQKPQMYVPVYPVRRQFDLKARFEQHNISLNMSLENKLQRTPSYIPHILDSQIMSDLSDPQLTKPDDNKKKSNLKSNNNKTVEKKQVKIEEKRKSQSEAKKSKKSDDTGKSPKKSDKPPKAPKAGEKTLKKDKSNTSLSKSPKKSKDKKDNAITVDSYLKNVKKKA